MADQFNLSYFLRNPDSTGSISLPASLDMGFSVYPFIICKV